MNYFVYSEKEISYLSKKDKKLAAAIEKIGMIEREVTPDVFEALINSIVGQQISNKAADTVRRKLVELCGEITHQTISAKSIDEIQKCGVSFRKAEYILGAAHAAEHSIDFSSLHMLTDAEITEKLTQIKGVGEWTAEMLLIFSLQRPDVVSYKDLAIRRGIMTLYGLKSLTPQQFLRYKKRYSPYGTVASLYLWQLSHD